MSTHNTVSDNAFAHMNNDGIRVYIIKSIYRLKTIGYHIEIIHLIIFYTIISLVMLCNYNFYPILILIIHIISKIIKINLIMQYAFNNNYVLAVVVLILYIINLLLEYVILFWYVYIVLVYVLEKN
jgi:hypothetical protein